MSSPLPSDLAAALEAASPRLEDFALVRYFAEIDSTNDAALALAASGAPEGTSVLADMQRKGRGRRGRAWFSPPEAGIYLSVIARADNSEPIKFLTVLTLAAGIASAEALAQTTGLQLELKWPNDLVCGRPWRKAGGVLCESSGVGSRVDAVVIGIGLNLRQTAFPPELADRATSIEGELGRPVARAPVVIELLARLRDALTRLHHGDTAWVTDDWRRLGRAGLGGSAVRWSDSTGDRFGLARDIDRDGALLVEVNGTIERLVAGEVFWDRLARP